MTSTASTTIGTSLEIAKSYVDRLVGVCVSTPYMKAITESTYQSGSFDTINNAGIVAPDNAVSVSTTTGSLTGTYSYYVQFWDNNRSVAGSESAQSSSVSPSGQGVSIDLTTITNESANSRVTHIDIYRNQNGGSTYYFVTRVTAATTS